MFSDIGRCLVRTGTYLDYMGIERGDLGYAPGEVYKTRYPASEPISKGVRSDDMQDIV